jgi:hypothetical protein
MDEWNIFWADLRGYSRYGRLASGNFCGAKKVPNFETMKTVSLFESVVRVRVLIKHIEDTTTQKNSNRHASPGILRDMARDEEASLISDKRPLVQARFFES